MEPGDRPLPADRHVFRYCPQCRTGMTRRVDGGSERPACPACGLVQYLNPAPAAGIVLLREGRVCLVKRRYEPKQGQWSLPSGFMEWDEAQTFTAQREALEETGLEVELDGLYAVEQGLLPPERPQVRAILTRKVQSPMGEDEFLRVTVGQVGDRLVATPLQRGAGVLMSMVQADGLVRIARFSEGQHAGSAVTVELLRPAESVRNTIVAIGSHDLTLDVLADQLRRVQPALALSSANVGSLGGLLALQRGEAHLAGSHLLDETTGDYNVKFIRELLPGRRIVLLRFVGRVQGLIVPAGNPKRIFSLHDLIRPDVAFINRQRGAGTRVLLDYELQRLGLKARQIRGYERQEYTHLAVAAAVKSGAADCGLGILAAARALGLSFVPLFNERYDLVIPAEHYESDKLAPLLAVIRRPEFAATVEALGGYDTADIGQVIAEL